MSDENDLSGRVAVVTGASSGLALQFARSAGQGRLKAGGRAAAQRTRQPSDLDAKLLILFAKRATPSTRP